MEKNKIREGLIWAAIAAALWSGIYLAGRSPAVSTYLKGKLVSRAELYLGRPLKVRDIFLNVFPLSLDIRGIVVGGEKGNLLSAERVKISLDPIDLIGSKKVIRRISILRGNLWLDADTVKGMAAVGGGGQAGPVEIKNITATGTNIMYEDGERSIKAFNVNFSSIMKGDPEIRFRVPVIECRSGSFSIAGLSAGGRLSIGKSAVRLESISVSSPASSLRMRGRYSLSERNLNARLSLSLDAGELGRFLKIRHPGKGRIRSSGRVVYADGSLSSEMKVSGEFYLESLMEALRLTEPLSGLTSFSGNISFKNGRVVGNGDAELVNGCIYGIDIEKARVAVSYNDKKLSFTKGKASFYGGSGDVSVVLAMPRVESFSVDVSAKKVSASKILKLLNIDSPLSEGVVTGELHTSGGHFDPNGWFAAQFTPGQESPVKRIERMKGKFSKNGDSVSLRDFEAEMPGTKITTQGEVDIKEMNLSLYSTIKTEDVGGIVGDYLKGFSGSAFAAFRISGPMSDPDVNGIVNISDPEYRNYHLSRIESSFEYRKERIRIHRLSLSGSREKHELSGTVAFLNPGHLLDISHPVFHLRANLSDLDVEEAARAIGYESPVRGSASGSVDLEGGLSDLRSHASVRITPVSAYGVELDYLKMEMNYRGRKFDIPDLEIGKEKSVISCSLKVGLDGTYEMKTKQMLIRPEHIPLNLNLSRGVISARISGKGSLKNPYLTSRVEVEGLQVGGIPIGHGEVDLVLKNNLLSFSGSVFNGLSTLNGSVRLSDPYEWNLAADFKRGLYNFLPALVMKEIPEDLMVNLEGGLKLSGTRDSVQGAVKISQCAMSLYGFNFSNSSDISLLIRDRKIMIESLGLKSGNSSIDFSGEFVPFKNLDISIYGDSGLLPLQKFVKSIDAIKGNGVFVFSIEGDWYSPVVNGGISISKASMGIRGFPYRIMDLDSYIFIDNDRVVIDSLSGKIGGGSVSMKGYGYLKSYSVERFFLDTTLEDVTFRFSPGMVVNFNGSLVYRGEEGKSSMVGQVNVIRARYTQRVDWKTQLLKIKMPERPRGKLSPFEETELNIKIDGNNDIVIDNNIAKTSLRVDLLLRGTVASPHLFGRIETDTGSVFFRNNEFEIVHASADFVDPDKFNPYFDINASTTVKGISIKIAIEGQLQHFDLSLSSPSDPSLDETDILGLLTVGQVGSKLKGLEGGIGTAEATSFLTGKYQDVIEERLTSLTGFDRFQIEPYISEKTGTISPRFTVSKRLIGDKLFVTYSSAVGASRSDIIKLEYQIDRHVSLVGVRDETGSIGADLKFRFEFK